MNTAPLDRLAEEWEGEADTLRRRGAPGQADLMESLVEDLQERIHAWKNEELTIREAAQETGYSPKRLREMVREGRIPDNRPNGSNGTIRVRRKDLPRKPGGGDGDAVAEVESLAGKIEQGRG